MKKLVAAFLIKFKAGRNFVAIREDEMAAVTVGIDVFKYKMAAMGYSSALCGLAGGLLAHYMTNVNPAMFTSAKSNELLIAVVLGGRGSLTGVILAAAILTPLPELLRFSSAQEWRLRCFRCLRNGKSNVLEHFPAASSKCLPLEGVLWQIRGYFCWMNHLWDWHLSSLTV